MITKVILLVSFSFVFLLGLYLGSQGQGKASAIKSKTAEIEDVAHALNAAAFINMAYAMNDSSSEERKESRRNSLLISLLLSLSQAEKYKNENQEDTFISHGYRTLYNLRVYDRDELNHLVLESDLVDSYKDPFLNPENTLHEELISFIDRSYTVMVESEFWSAHMWLKSINTGSIQDFKNSYSPSIIKSDEEWKTELKKYQDDFDELDLYSISFTSSSDAFSEGDVTIYHNDVLFKEIEIEMVNEQWKVVREVVSD